MANWTRNNAGELVKREIVGWGRHLVSITATAKERAFHAIECRNGWERVAACGAPAPNGFRDVSAAPPRGDSFSPRCRACEGIALDLIGVKAVA